MYCGKISEIVYIINDLRITLVGNAKFRKHYLNFNKKNTYFKTSD